MFTPTHLTKASSHLLLKPELTPSQFAYLSGYTKLDFSTINMVRTIPSPYKSLIQLQSDSSPKDENPISIFIVNDRATKQKVTAGI